MINVLIESISIALNAEFGDKPCFIIQCINSTQKQFLGKKYFRNDQFCVQYSPGTAEEGGECHKIGERLFECLEYLTVNGESVRGTKMNYEVVDGILHFYVNYSMYVYKRADPVPVMEEVSAETCMKA